MRICVWKTGHEIADTVAEAVYEGLDLPIDGNGADGKGLARIYCGMSDFEGDIGWGDIHIGYGILRGMDDVFRACHKAGKPFIHIDRGYFKPGHYDGYYRVSLNGTQQTTGLDKLEPDYARWDGLGIEILPEKSGGTYTLCCPMSPHVKEFFRDIDPYVYSSLPFPEIKEPAILRTKDSKHPIESHMLYAKKVVTFNSSVGWETLRQGIPVVSDPTHSIVGSYLKMIDRPIHGDMNERRKLFAIMSSLQLTIAEMRSGMLLPLINKLLQSNA